MQTNGMPYAALSQQQRQSLRSDGNFVGGILILVLGGLTFLFSTIAALAVRGGLLSPDALNFDDLGLGNTRYLLLYGCVYIVCMGFPALLCCLLFGRRLRGLFTPRALSLRTQTAAVWIGLGGCIGANIVASLVASFLQDKGISLPDSPSFLEATPTSFALNLVVLALLPAVLEELVFRVCVLGTLRKYGDWFAIAVSAVLFGVIHGNIVQSVFALLVGLVLGYITLSTGNVRLAIGIHFLNNTLSVLLEYITLSMDEIMRNVVYAAVLYGVGIIGGVVALVCLFRRSAVYRRLLLTPYPTGACVGNLLKSPLMILGLIMIVLRIALFLR